MTTSLSIFPLLYPVFSCKKRCTSDKKDARGNRGRGSPSRAHPTRTSRPSLSKASNPTERDLPHNAYTLPRCKAAPLRKTTPANPVLFDGGSLWYGTSLLLQVHDVVRVVSRLAVVKTSPARCRGLSIALKHLLICTCSASCIKRKRGPCLNNPE